MEVTGAGEPTRELFEACRNGDLERVKKLINPDNVNSRDTAGRKSTPLHFAAEGKTLARMVQYIQRTKALPAVLPADVSSAQRMEDMPKHLIPLETFCSDCPGKVPLSDPIVITQRARISTFTGVLEDVTTYCKCCEVFAVRRLCKECGLDNRGSKMDLVLRMREEMKNRSTYDKVFEKVWGASGSHIFLMRSIIHNHNDRVNKKAVADLKKVCDADVDITIDCNGKAVLGFGRRDVVDYLLQNGANVHARDDGGLISTTPVPSEKHRTDYRWAFRIFTVNVSQQKRSESLLE
ncbi:hypothetical protein SKAU_G00150020 [Synaphobranchus kaupii]|uniref:Uncharacterized protein n=1 Tax=Synaphobranchus kaupii TaxID=118154 RepID=A0A9Q1J4U9_SYNKA|nr:hypothetical protein SKAU_G00150020 [Synaphobranchus kaupii]